MEWGQAKVEVNALRDEIFARLEAGQTVKRVYEELNDKGRVSMTLRAFYVGVNRLRTEATRERTPSRPQSANTTRRTRTPEPQTSFNAQPSSSRASEPDGPRVVDAAFNRMPASRGPAPSSSASAVNQDLWDGNLPDAPEGAS